jgi:putative membrane protein
MMMGGGGFLVVGVILFLFLLLIGGLVVGVVWLVRQGPGGFDGGTPQAEGRTEEEALEILRRRYARGEISREEFESMREDIRS